MASIYAILSAIKNSNVGCTNAPTFAILATVNLVNGFGTNLSTALATLLNWIRPSSVESLRPHVGVPVKWNSSVVTPVP